MLRTSTEYFEAGSQYDKQPCDITTEDNIFQQQQVGPGHP